MSSPLRIIPLGGLSEIGMNLMVYEAGGEAIVVDCGMSFPDAATLGVDVIIPDLTYLEALGDRLRAVFLTHGHEDHVGAIPFLLERRNVPVYGMPLTIGFVRDKLEEFGLAGTAQLRTMEPRQVVEEGPFRVEAIRVTHSIVDALGFAITTPLGVVIHTGDFKLDNTPIDRLPTDLARFAEYGERGVLVLLSDSTNALVPGWGPSERTVGHAFDHVFAAAKGRILVTTFASHIHRVQQIIDSAKRFRRKVFLVGRSLVDNIDTAERLGYVRFPREVRAGSARPGDLDPKETVIITTGTQGEPTSALSRMAAGEHKHVEVGPGDLVIISARTIPGNERAVSHMIDNLYRLGAEVVSHEAPDIHVSGHACQEELRLMLNVTRPKFFIPIHGTLRHLVHHGRLAEETGVPSSHVAVITNGNVAEVDGERIEVLPERVEHGKVFVDAQAEEVAEIVVRDRQHLAEDGFVIVVAAIDSEGRLVRDPEIITRGTIHVDASGELLEEVRILLLTTFRESSIEEVRDPEIMQEKMRAVLKRYFRKNLGRRPMILPVIWEM